MQREHRQAVFKSEREPARAEWMPASGRGLRETAAGEPARLLAKPRLVMSVRRAEADRQGRETRDAR